MSYLLVLLTILVFFVGAGIGYLCFVRHPVRIGRYKLIGPRDKDTASPSWDLEKTG